MTSHMLGGDWCRECLGKASGYCRAPAIDGLCDEHRQARERRAKCG